MDVMKMGVVWNEKARVAWQKMVVLKINLVSILKMSWLWDEAVPPRPRYDVKCMIRSQEHSSASPIVSTSLNTENVFAKTLIMRPFPRSPYCCLQHFWLLAVQTFDHPIDHCVDHIDRIHADQIQQSKIEHSQAIDSFTTNQAKYPSTSNHTKNLFYHSTQWQNWENIKTKAVVANN